MYDQPAPADLRGALRRTLSALVAMGVLRTPLGIDITVHDAYGETVVFHFRESELAAAESPPAAPPGVPLSDIQRAVLAACGPEPVTAKRIASLTGYSPSSYLSACLTELCRLSLLVKVPDGYKLPD